MYTLKDLKQRFIDYLMAMDLDKLDMSALNSYSFILKALDDMEKPGYAESLSAIMGSIVTTKMDEEAKENA